MWHYKTGIKSCFFYYYYYSGISNIAKAHIKKKTQDKNNVRILRSIPYVYFMESNKVLYVPLINNTIEASLASLDRALVNHRNAIIWMCSGLSH